MKLGYSLAVYFIFGTLLKLAQNVNVTSKFYADYIASLRRNQRAAAPEDESGSCTTPGQLLNGRWSYLNSEIAAVSGRKVLPSTVIVFRCNKGYKLSITNEKVYTTFCIDGEWTLSQTPMCEKLCRPIYNTHTTTVTCRKSGLIVPCDKATHRTTITFKCESFYENFGVTSGTCVFGKWSFSEVSCTPICGEKRVSARPLIINGEKVDRGNYPWAVAIYSNRRSDSFELICGGSLLSIKLILTAAHCIAKDQNGEPYATRYFRIAAGKYYKQYEHPDDENTTQYSEINKIEVHPDYKGEEQHFRADIAILKLKSTLQLSDVIQPVCYRELISIPLDFNQLGIVTGWGYTAIKGKQSEILKELEIPYKDDITCRSEFGRQWSNRFFTSDKMCAGFFNKSTSVCIGDSGGGLVFLNPRNERYYIHGIVSITQTFIEDNKKLCDIQKAALFTRVSAQSIFEWLQIQVDSLAIEGCTLPVDISNGKWIYSDTKTDVSFQENIFDNSIITIKCNPGYKLIPDDFQIQCGSDGYWNMTSIIPVCELILCPPHNDTYSTIFTCEKEGTTIPCARATDGTKLRITCNHYESPSLDKDFSSTCIDGSWSHPIHECSSVCGTRKESPSLLIKQGSGLEADISEYPWTVAIYRSDPDDPSQLPILICGGVLVKPNFVLTVAHCLTQESGMRSTPLKDYHIATGKSFISYSDTRDNTAEFSKVDGVYIHAEFRGYSQNYRADIAIIKLKKYLTLSHKVRPVCFHGAQNIAISPDVKGYLNKLLLSGWPRYNKVVEDSILGLEVPYIPTERCRATFDEEFANKFLISDKICSGNPNENTSVCIVLSGSGLVSKSSTDNRYYIEGLLSLGQTEHKNGEFTCKPNSSGIFTSVDYYQRWIQSIIDPAK